MMTALNKNESRRVCALLTLTLWLALALALTACAAPQPPAAGPTAVATTASRSQTPAPPVAAAATPVASHPISSAPMPRSKPAPPMSDPLPAERMPDARPAPAGAAPDTSCRTSADCMVKNVGSCCGIQPSCVNVNAKVDPQAVQAQCARSGMMSTCGFRPVESCECVRGQCKDQLMTVDAQ